MSGVLRGYRQQLVSDGSVEGGTDYNLCLTEVLRGVQTCV